MTEYRLNVHEDILGSSTWYTRQENGYNANHHDYTTWGNNTKAPSYNYDPEYRATEPYFTGHPYDGSLNLYYAENRFYDPETGSWLSPDPAGDGLNWYQYCGSNPVTCVDPLGLYPTAGAAGILEGEPGKYNYYTKLSGSREMLKMDSEGYQFLNWLKNTEIGNIFNRKNPNYVYDDYGNLIGIGIQNAKDGFITIGYGHIIQTEADAKKYGFQFWEGGKSETEIDTEKDRQEKYYESLNLRSPAILSLMEADALLKEDLKEYRKLAEGLRENGRSYSTNQMDGLTSNVYNAGKKHSNDPDSLQYYLIKNDAVGAINVLREADKKKIYGSQEGLLRRRLMEYNIYFNNDYTFYNDTNMDELKKITGF